MWYPDSELWRRRDESHQSTPDYAEAPGVHRENMDVGLEGNVLTLSGRREFWKDEESEEYIWKEREQGKFVRSLRLPKPVQEGKVTATYK